MDLSEASRFFDNQHFNSQAKRTWADLGCGDGPFTRALAKILPLKSMIYAVDKNAVALKKISSSDFVTIQTLQADFVKDELRLPALDGILMANSLHYAKDKKGLVEKLSSYLAKDSVFAIVEYDTDEPVSRWVPFPISFKQLMGLFNEAGYRSVIKLHEQPSIYGRSNLYSAIVKR